MDGVHSQQNGRLAFIEKTLDELPWVTKVYKRDLDFAVQCTLMLNPFIRFTTRSGCRQCVISAVAAKHSESSWRLRISDDWAAEEKQAFVEDFPGLKEIFLPMMNLQLSRICADAVSSFQKRS